MLGFSMGETRVLTGGSSDYYGFSFFTVYWPMQGIQGSNCPREPRKSWMGCIRLVWEHAPLSS